MITRPRCALMLLFTGVGILAGCTTVGEEDTAPTSRVAPTTEAAMDSPGQEEPPSESDYSIAYESPDASDFNLQLQSEDGLEDLQQVEILNVDTAEVDQLVISFEMESHHCFGVETAVDESDTEVIVDIRSGRRSGVLSTDCVYGVFPYTTAVELASPLGDRVIVQAEPTEPADTSVLNGDSSNAGPGGTTGSGVERYLGEHVEDGVEWAIVNGFEWRILSYDGEPVDADGPTDPDRISFVVERDLIVAYEWS